MVEVYFLADTSGQQAHQQLEGLLVFYCQQTSFIAFDVGQIIITVKSLCSDMLITMKERKARIELGLGMERLISDSEAGSIMDNYIIPYIRDGDYGKGFIETTKVVAGIILKDYLEKGGDVFPKAQ